MVCDKLDIVADPLCSQQVVVIWDFILLMHSLKVFVDTSGRVTPGDTNGQRHDYSLPSEFDIADLQQGVQA